VQFEPIASALIRGDNAARNYDWEGALEAYKTALLQERNRDVIDKALKMYKQIVDFEGAPALAREIRFCRSVVLAHPDDVDLLQHMAELYFRAGAARQGRDICRRILALDPDNEFAKKSLAAVGPTP
jgi:hypothetical protein